MSLFEIRLAQRSDARQIALISRDYIEHGLGWGYPPSRIVEIIGEPETNVIVAVRDTKLAGFAIMEHEAFEAHLILFGVLPAYRRQGAGSTLLHWLMTTAAVAGAQVVYVELRKTNNTARQFYESLGFTHMEPLRKFYSNSEDGMRMALDLRHREKDNAG
jgi:ribosomal-protein-alanine N-acetyltransferase